MSLFIGLISFPVYAEKNEKIDYAALANEHYEITPETNEIPNWPTGPQTYADAAILMDANTGAILYAKNIYKAEYPASTTKLLTGLLAMENCGMDEIVDFSSYACDIPWDASSANMKSGDRLYMEQAMYALMVGSANEVATAIGEHISGSEEDFANLMNQRAKELGCVNTHFVNANGLFDEEHYTCAYDLALIAREYFSYELLSRMSSTYHYFIDASDMQPEDKDIYSHNKLLPGQSYAYDKLVGSKTGYTNMARSTLVTCAQSGNMKLICVVLQEESPNQFEDTISLFEYGFRNFSCEKVVDVEKKYSLEDTDRFSTGSDLLGKSEPILYLDPNALITIPATTTFEELDCELVYDTQDDDTIGTLIYSYHGQVLGTSYIRISGESAPEMDFNEVGAGEEIPISDSSAHANDAASSDEAPGEGETDAQETSQQDRIIYVNVKQVIVVVVIGAIILIALIYIIAYIRSYQFASKRRDKRRRQRFKRGYGLQKTQKREKGTRIRHKRQKRWKRWK